MTGKDVLQVFADGAHIHFRTVQPSVSATARGFRLRSGLRCSVRRPSMLYRLCDNSGRLQRPLLVLAIQAVALTPDDVPGWEHFHMKPLVVGNSVGLVSGLERLA